MALRVKGTGYAAVGWRPKNASKKCQAYPKLYDRGEAARSLGELFEDEDGDAEVEVEAEGKEAYAEAEAGAEVEGEPEDGKPEGYSDLEEDGKAEAEAESDDIDVEAEKNSKEDTQKRKARRIINKSVDVSIGYVTHSVSTAHRRRRSADPEAFPEYDYGKLH